MKKLRTVALLVLFLALLALFAVGGSGYRTVHATTTVYDFTVGDQGWTVDGGVGAAGTYVGGTGWTASDPTPANPRSVAIDKSVSFAGGEFMTITVNFNNVTIGTDPTPSARNGIIAIFMSGSQVGASANIHLDAGETIRTFTTTTPFDEIRLSYQVSSGGPLTTGSATITSVVLDTTSFTPTPTLGAAPTSSAGGGGSFEGQCLLLGDDSSLFMTLPGAWTLDPSTLGHGTGGTGLKLEIGQASIVLNLNKYHKYQIALRFHVEDSGSGDIFSFKLGSTAATTVSVEASADEQTFVTASGGQNFEPDDPAAADIYTFTLKELLHVEDNGTLVIDLACIEDRTPDVQLVPQGGEDSPPGVCASCDYTPTGNLLNDLMAIFAWLWCGLSQLFDCVLKPLLLGVWRTIIDVLRWLNFVRIWAGLIWSNLGSWLGNAWIQFLYWLIGAMNNVQTAFKNIVFAFFDSPIGAFLVNGISAILNNPLSAIIANTAHTVETVAGSVGNIIQLGAYYLGLIFNAVVTILGAIPEIFIALVNGYNASPTSIPVWAPTCNSANTFLYYPCLGSYILDNTLLDGPAYLMFILLLGLVAVNTILWTVRQLQEALAK